MDNTAKQQLLGQAALRARQRPFFLSQDLTLYRDAHGMTEEELAEWLGCSQEQLARLALCRRPEGSDQFRQMVERMAAYSGADPLRLVRALREVDALAALRQTGEALGSAEGWGYLLAARDREPEVAPAEDMPPQDPTDAD